MSSCSAFWPLIPKHQATSIPSAEQISIAFDQFQRKKYIFNEQDHRLKWKFEKQGPAIWRLIPIQCRVIKIRTARLQTGSLLTVRIDSHCLILVLNWITKSLYVKVWLSLPYLNIIPQTIGRSLANNSKHHIWYWIILSCWCRVLKYM